MTFEDLDLDEEDFEDIGTHLRSIGGVRSGMVGEAESHLFDMTAGVEAARAWTADHRRPDDGAVTGGAAGS